MPAWLRKLDRDLCGGALMFLLGLAAMIQGSAYQIGTLDRMGPGFFPVALGVILACVGLAIAIAARLEPVKVERARLPPEWRGWFLICVSIVAFVVIGTYGGLVPATFAIVFISALGDRSNSVRSAIALSLVVLVICIAVFSWALQMPFPLFRWG